jgi:hypothetical protein
MRTLALVRSLYPVRYETAFGTVASNDFGRDIGERLRALVSEVPEGRRTVFSYPGEASLYLTLPAENPTPFSLLVPGYNTPEQFRTAFAALADGGADYVVVAPLFVRRADDPLIKFLEGRYVLRERLSVLGPDVYVPVRPRAGRPVP